MTMILATAEYSFKIDYIPGIRNILADFGTRFIDESEWDKPQEDDNEGLHQLFSFQVELPVHIMKFLYDTQLTKEDKQELQKAHVVYEQRGKIIMVSYQISNYFTCLVVFADLCSGTCIKIYMLVLSKCCKTLENYTCFGHICQSLWQNRWDNSKQAGI